jgi:hypothetical protein
MMVDNEDDDTEITDNEEEGLQQEVSAVLTLMDLTIPVLFHIYNFLGETQEELINLTLVSKQTKKICKMYGIEWKIIPTIIISPHQDSGSGLIFSQKLGALACDHANKHPTNWERVSDVDPEDRTVKSSSFMYFENGLDGVHKARQDAEALIAANPKISLLLRDVILASTFATIDRKENYFLDIEKNKKRDLQSYTRLRVIDIDKFNYKDVSHEQFESNVQSMDWILSLDLSLSSPSKKSMIFPLFFASLFPNLIEVDFSNTNFHCTLLEVYSDRCPLLEKITYCNNTLYCKTWIELCGFDMRHSSNLKQIYMDDFVFKQSQAGIDLMVDLNRPDTTFIFHLCCNVLERLSIRNAKWRDHKWRDQETDRYNAVIPQNALIKFVRNAPSLRWFRSDLTPENINMLRLERPEIELLT